MAKKSKVAKEIKRQKLVEKYAEQRRELIEKENYLEILPLLVLKIDVK